MKEFDSFAGMATHLAALVLTEEVAAQALMETVGVLVEHKAKAKIGEYQEQAGPFVAWAELADSTKADREAQGFSDDEPLLRTGDMRDSIEHKATPDEARIGSNSDIAVYQELGTEHIPPRSFLGGAAFEETDKILKIVGAGFTAYLEGEDVVNGRLKIEGR